MNLTTIATREPVCHCGREPYVPLTIAERDELVRLAQEALAVRAVLGGASIVAEAP